jgi:hypothetical protein
VLTVKIVVHFLFADPQMVQTQMRRYRVGAHDGP